VSLLTASVSLDAAASGPAFNRNIYGHFAGAGMIVTPAPAMNAHNTFEHPDAVTAADFTAFSRKEENLTIALPAKSIVTLKFS